MNIFDEPKIDCHNHVLDPVRFPYADDVACRPAGQEIGTQAQHRQLMDAHGVRRAAERGGLRGTVDSASR